MKVNPRKFEELKRTFGFGYIGQELPPGGVRIHSYDSSGMEHSIVLTRDNFVEAFGSFVYQKTTDLSTIKKERNETHK